MRPRVAIIYNEPTWCSYNAAGEEKAVHGVLGEVMAVYRALIELGYPVVRVPLSPPLEQARKSLEQLKTDLVFNLFEGFCGYPKTEAAMADILSELGLIYTGCHSSVLSLALSKAKVKAVWQKTGIDTPAYQLLSPETLPQFDLRYPCIVKPCEEDASHGVLEESVVYDFATLGKQVSQVSKRFGGEVLVEEFVEGREVSAAILGAKKPIVLPLSEIAYSLPPGWPRILTFSAKWESQSMYFYGTKTICPADIEMNTQRHINDIALSVFRMLGCSGYARVDFRLDSRGSPRVLEVNPNPDISPDAGLAHQAQAAGIVYNQLIEKIAMLALREVS